ncbi:hypothetical protein SDC9_63498 [bioreactor metagenome]|uniref:Uncharacterized protein n=1 Tax=bioreactor metagenome TaxID=1076179 RepID=A0A644XS72_9ZZZZ
MAERDLINEGCLGLFQFKIQPFQFSGAVFQFTQGFSVEIIAVAFFFQPFAQSTGFDLDVRNPLHFDLQVITEALLSLGKLLFRILLLVSFFFQGIHALCYPVNIIYTGLKALLYLIEGCGKGLQFCDAFVINIHIFFLLLFINF